MTDTEKVKAVQRALRAADAWESDFVPDPGQLLNEIMDIIGDNYLEDEVEAE